MTSSILAKSVTEIRMVFVIRLTRHRAYGPAGSGGLPLIRINRTGRRLRQCNIT